MIYSQSGGYLPMDEVVLYSVPDGAGKPDQVTPLAILPARDMNLGQEKRSSSERLTTTAKTIVGASRL